MRMQMQGQLLKRALLVPHRAVAAPGLGSVLLGAVCRYVVGNCVCFQGSSGFWVSSRYTSHNDGNDVTEKVGASLCCRVRAGTLGLQLAVL